MSRLDPHSFTDGAQPRVHPPRPRPRPSISTAASCLGHGRPHARGARERETLDLDTKGLAIREARTEAGAPLPFALGDETPILGRRLRLSAPGRHAPLRDPYETSPEAVALQWLDPAQTAGGAHPFLYSQCQAIHARTVFPAQDTPAIRVTYRAAVTVPEPLSAVMSAGPAGERPGPRPGTRTFLLRDAAADSAVSLRPRGGPARRSRSLTALASPRRAGGRREGRMGVRRGSEMIRTAEGLFGPYPWERYDLLVLPPSFPYGGMENPRMTFLTPTVIAGDRSLVDVVAHELAHSWTGNLVTNATMEHFWLNEGSTTWAERRILEALHGEGAAVLSWAIGETALRKAFERFGADSPLTKLRTDLAGRRPRRRLFVDPLREGGSLFRAARADGGARAFRPFPRRVHGPLPLHVDHVGGVLAFLDEKLPGLSDQVRADDWLSKTGMPANAPSFRSARLEELTGLAAGFSGGAAAGRGGPRRVVAGRDTRLPAASAAPDARRIMRVARWDAPFERPGKSRASRRVADDRRGLGLRAGLCAASRGSSLGRADEVPPAALHGDGWLAPDADARAGDLRRGPAPLSRPLRRVVESVLEAWPS